MEMYSVAVIETPLTAACPLSPISVDQPFVHLLVKKEPTFWEKVGTCRVAAVKFDGRASSISRPQ